MIIKNINKNENIKFNNMSLRWKLILITLFCFVLPVLIIVGVTGYYVTRNINNQIEDTIKTSVNNSVTLCKNNLDSAAKDSRKASYYNTIAQGYQRYKEDNDYNELHQVVTSFLSTYYKYDNKFLTTNVFLYDNPNINFYTFNDTYSGAYSNVLKYNKNAHEKAINLSKTIGTDIGFLCIDDDIYMVRNMLDSNFKPFAVIVMELNFDSVFDSIESISWQKNITLKLAGTTLNVSGESLVGVFDNINVPKNDFVFERKRKESILYGSLSTEAGLLEFIISFNDKAIMQELSTFTKILVGIFISIIPLLLWALLFFNKNINKPTDELINASNKIKGGDFGYQIEGESSNKEFYHLKDSFNSMSRKLKYQFDTIYSEELALRDARISALQSQINPHFLNNTLELINWEARFSGNDKVSNMIESLSTMLDAAMNRTGNQLIPLLQEIKYVDAYLYITKERLGERITIEKQIDENLKDYYIPRLILQPIVENAVEHGVCRQSNGKVCINIYKADNNMVIKVINDGKLLEEDKEKINKLLSMDIYSEGDKISSLGIRNVNQRLKMIYGKNSGLTIKMNKNLTVESIIIIPIN